MSQQSTGSMRGMGPVDGGPFTAVAGIALLINLVGLYSFTGVALCVFGYIVLTLVLSSRAERTAKNIGSAQAGTVAIVLSWIVALVGGVVVGAFHWVHYSQAAYAVLAMYAVAVLIWLCGKAYDAFWSWLFPIVGLAMLWSVMQLAAPPGADDMEKKESWTPVNVMAFDEAGRPIEGATVYLDLVQFWKGDPALDGDREWWSKDTTEKDGTAQMAIHEDPRFKRLLIRVRHEPFGRGYSEPTTIGGYVGHEDVRLQTTLPAPKIPYSFQVTMKERAHPDTALLALDVDAAVSADAIVGRNIKLALTPEPELPWHEGGRTFNDYLVMQNGVLRDLFLNGPQCTVISLGRDLAGRPLTLHVLERDATRYDDAYLTLARLSIPPIPLGEHLVLPTIMLPAQRSASGSESVAEGTGNTDRR